MHIPRPGEDNDQRRKDGYRNGMDSETAQFLNNRNNTSKSMPRTKKERNHQKIIELIQFHFSFISGTHKKPLRKSCLIWLTIDKVECVIVGGYNTLHFLWYTVKEILIRLILKKPRKK